MLEALGTWAVTWTFGEPTREELDPDLLMWWVHRHVPADQFPPTRTTVEFEFTDVRRRYWVLLTAEEATLCPQPPGFDTDVAVRTTCSLLYQVWQGHTRTGTYRGTDLLQIQGPRALRVAVRHWLDNGPLAALVLDVAAGSPAAAAGVRAGDVVTGFSGGRVGSVGDLLDALRDVDPGQRVDVVLQRGEEQRTVPVTVGRRTP
jgi:hypothetical protein